MADEKKAKKSAKEKADKNGKKKSNKNPFKAIGGFFKSVRSEGKKVVWPKAAEVWKNTLVVLVVIIIVGLAIYAVDFGLTSGMKATKKAADNVTKAAATLEEAEEDDVELEEDTDAQAEPESVTEAQSEAVTEEDTTEAAD